MKKTDAQKQSDYRQRFKDKGLAEVRGAYCDKSLHDKVREFSKEIDEKQKKGER